MTKKWKIKLKSLNKKKIETKTNKSKNQKNQKQIKIKQIIRKDQKIWSSIKKIIQKKMIKKF